MSGAPDVPGPEGPAPSDRERSDRERSDRERSGQPADEDVLLAAFDAMAPEGSPAWRLSETLDRIEAPDGAEVIWPGVPAEVWRRGRAARVGERLAGEAMASLADALAADARAVVAAQTARSDRRFDATYDAVRLLTARLEALERAVHPVPDATVAATVPPPAVGPRLDELAGWLGPPPPVGPRRVLVGESGDGSMVRVLVAAGWRVGGVEPRGPLVWEAVGAGVDGTVVGEVTDHLARTERAALGGLVLAGIVDRAPLAGAAELVAGAATALAPAAAVVVLTTERAAWEAGLPPAALDLAPGRPLHPETWMALLERAGFGPATWYPPDTGAVHAVVARRP